VPSADPSVRRPQPPTTPASPGPTRRDALLGAGAIGASVLAWPSHAVAAHPRRRRRAQDLTHPLRAGFPVFVGDPPAR